MRGVLVRSGLFVSLIVLCNLPVQADLIMSSAPRDTQEKEEALFRPIAAYLSKAIGEKVSFRYGDNYLTYQSEMRKGHYDILLDGPQFVSWRMARLEHVPLVKFPGNLVFVAIVKNDNARIKELKDLAGHTVCAFPSPNLATLTVLYEFDNPARQPLIVEIQNFPEVYQGVKSGHCTGGILQAKLFENLDKEARIGRVLFKSKPLPNQAFSAGPRVTAEKRERLKQALLSPEGAVAMKQLLDIYKIKAALEPATVEEFTGLGKLLRDIWGFELK